MLSYIVYYTILSVYVIIYSIKSYLQNPALGLPVSDSSSSARYATDITPGRSPSITPRVPMLLNNTHSSGRYMGNNNSRGRRSSEISPSGSNSGDAYDVSSKKRNTYDGHASINIAPSGSLDYSASNSAGHNVVNNAKNRPHPPSNLRYPTVDNSINAMDMSGGGGIGMSNPSSRRKSRSSKYNKDNSMSGGGGAHSGPHSGGENSGVDYALQDNSTRTIDKRIDSYNNSMNHSNPSNQYVDHDNSKWENDVIIPTRCCILM